MIFMLAGLRQVLHEDDGLRPRKELPSPAATACFNSCTTSGVGTTPRAGTQTQTTAEPLTGSGTPITAASATFPVASRRASISAGPVRLPEILRASLDRP